MEVLGVTEMSWGTLLLIGLVTVCIGLLTISRYGPFQRADSVPAKASSSEELPNADLLDPLILKDHSEIRSFATSVAVYGSIRTFHHPYPHTEKLPDAGRLPLLVFVHGLGGSLVQFAPLLRSLVSIAPCYGIDFPGCGLSALSPGSFSAYTIEALTELVKTAISTACQENGHESVVLVSHSFGCPISALLTSTNAIEKTRLSVPVRGIVAICPKATPVSKSQTTIARALFTLPNFVLDGLRWLDRRGGKESKSVTRFVGAQADGDLKALQLRLNQQFSTPAWKRIALGALSRYDSEGHAHGGIPGEHVWKGINVPLLLLAGEADVVTKPKEMQLIVSYLIGRSRSSMNGTAPDIAPPTTKGSTDTLNTSKADERSFGIQASTDTLNMSKADERSFGIQASTTESTSHHAIVVKTAILPAPAAHALLYDHATYRTVAGLIEDFLAKYVSDHLSLGWQLQQLTTSGKWDVKNLEKWRKVMPVSGPIAGGVFRALKTLREQDEEHTPTKFVKQWQGKIYAVIDISHDRPIYNTQTLEKGGIQYHKFPTVSKVPPTPAEVKDFIALVERLRKEIKAKGHGESGEPAVACHCHYGYNRTGFFIICYLVEKMSYRLQDAIDEFAKQKPPGIRHDHFLDTLFVRYCVGLKKAPTFS